MVSHKFTRIVTYACIALGILLFVLLNVWVYFYGRRVSQQNMVASLFDQLRRKRLLTSATLTPSPSLTPTPYPIAQGKQQFKAQTSNKSDPQILEFTIDPFDPKINESQSFAVTVKDSEPIRSVTITLITDGNTRSPYPLKLISGTDREGMWSASWTTNTTHDYTYQAEIQATSSRGTTTVVPTFR